MNFPFLVSSCRVRTLVAMLLMSSLLLYGQLLHAQQPANATPEPTANIKSTEDTSTKPRVYPEAPQPALPVFNWYRNFRVTPPVEKPTVITDLLHNGVLSLSLEDAIALAIANNLDAEINRYDLGIADMDVVRTKGGGTSRGISFNVAQLPTGVGGPTGPLLSVTSSTASPTGTSISPSFFDVNEITEPQTNLSLQGSAAFSSGPPIPQFDPTLNGQLAWVHINPSDSSTTTVTPGGAGNTNSTLASLSALQGFSTGLTIQAGVNNNGAVASGLSQSNPFSTPNVQVAITQPLLRGFGVNVNRREIRVAQNDRKISRLLFRQQLIELVYGVTRLYYDLVSLNEDVIVKQDALAAARKLYDDDNIQVQVGTLAPIELMRVKALVSSAELDLVRSQGFLEQQEIILKTQLAQKGVADPAIKAVRIQPTSAIVVPAMEQFPAPDELVTTALANRPDLAQASLQVTNGKITLEGSRNQTRPEIDLIADVQTRGTIATSQVTGAAANPSNGSSLTTASLGQTGKIYEAGIEIGLPIRNRIARSDAGRDALQVRQMQARLQQLQNQVIEEVESASRGLQMARKAYDAAVQSRIYQEQLLQAEKDKLSVGASANFFIVQDQSFLAQSRSTEVAARSAYIKAKFALDRATGSVLENNHINVDDAIRK
jgi:outer membrane protein